MSSAQHREETTQVTSISSPCCILPFIWSQWGQDHYADEALHVSKPIEALELFVNAAYNLFQNRINEKAQQLVSQAQRGIPSMIQNNSMLLLWR